MMKRIAPLFVVPVLLALGGCVSSGKYNVCVNDLADARKSASALEAKLKAVEAERAGLRSDLEKLRAEKEGLAKEAARVGQDLDARIRSLEEGLKAKDAEIEKLKGEIGGLKAEAASLSGERARAIAEKEKVVSELAATRDRLTKELQEEIRKGEIAITQLKDRLSLNLVEKILFDSGSALVKKDGKKVLDRVAGILGKVRDKQIRIEGHTDNVPISARLAERFPTNWELSTARATNVTRYLQEKGVDPQYLVAAGFSEYRPIAPNDTPEGRAKNRRIEIVLTPYEAEAAPPRGTPRE
ncbi:MAG: OmpA family protein [Gemmatimonadota bacterium]